MYIRKLIISTPDEIIREIEFKIGMNLIVDNTLETDSKATGNNIGKTTVLKLIDFCLGADSKKIYNDDENKNKTYTEVKDFLVNNEVLITLILTDDLTIKSAREIVIKRNFLSRKRAIKSINGIDFSDKDFKCELEKEILPNKLVEFPTFRQVISPNIRYNDTRINNTLKFLDKYTSDIDYETLFLYLFGCNYDDAQIKKSLTTKVIQEEAFMKKLENGQKKSTYEIALSFVENDIKILNEKRATLNLSDDYEENLKKLDHVKYELNKKSSYLSKLNIRKSLINDSIQELNSTHADIDLRELRVLYDSAKQNVSGIQKTFENLVEYHNTMILEKIKFISKDLPSLETEIIDCEKCIQQLLLTERELTSSISKSSSFDELEKIISDLNQNYQQKGEYETIISQLTEVELKISEYSNEIGAIDKYLFSNDFSEKVKRQLEKFNKFFADISSNFYNERYMLVHEVTESKGRKVYKFSTFNSNISSGKKQGEILCFDLANILFARQEGIDTLNFLLNDKKELLHINQIVAAASFVKENNIQLIVPILNDKLNSEVLSNAHVAIELSQTSKLFKIE